MTASPQVIRVVSERVTHRIPVETFDTGSRGVRLQARTPVDVVCIPRLQWALYAEIPAEVGDGTGMMKLLTPANQHNGVLRIRDHYADWCERTRGTQTAAIRALEAMDPWTAGSLLDLNVCSYYAVFPPGSVMLSVVSVTTSSPSVKWKDK